MTGVMGIIEDITEPRRMAETLRQTSRALAITECHQALIRATDRDGIIDRGVPNNRGGGWLSHGLGGLCRGRRPQIGAPGGPNQIDEGYVGKVNVTWADKAGPRPVGTAIRIR